MTRGVQRYFGLCFLLSMAGFAAFGYFHIRRDVDNLRVISQDNILWTGMQMEVELLRFRSSVADLHVERTPEALREARSRFDILWSRVSLAEAGRVGELVREYDEGLGALPALQAYLAELDPVLSTLSLDETERLAGVLQDLDAIERSLRLYSMRVIEGDTAASAVLRDRIRFSSGTMMVVCLASILLSLLALGLILRENRRQREVAELNRRIADDAERASRAKSWFLATMSHELRNPLNGVLAPLALLGQAGLNPRQRRLVEQARQSGSSMVQLLGGLLDFGQMQEDGLAPRSETFRLAALAAMVRAELEKVGAGAVKVVLNDDAPEMAQGDIERVAGVFVHLGEYVFERGKPEAARIRLRHRDETLVGWIEFSAQDALLAWKLDLIMGLNDAAPDQFRSEALRPLIARGLVSALGGEFGIVAAAGGGRAIRVALPLPQVRFERIRVRLVTRSDALATIYRMALRSERIIFAEPEDAQPVDMVLIDATSIGEPRVMNELRSRNPDALFVSLGMPRSPDCFDDVVETPSDMTRLRSSILGRFAS